MYPRYLKNFLSRNRQKSSQICLIICLSLMAFVQVPEMTAQVSQTIYFMDNLPQASLLNPAHRPSHNFHIGLPAISSLNFNARTNFATYSDIIFKHPRYDSLITFLHPDASLSDFTSKLKADNFVSPDIHINLLSFGFRIKESYLSFGISERASFRASLPKDLIMLALSGNEQFAGKTADFSGLMADMNYFREYGIGISHAIDSKLNVGARAKILFGKANISFSDADISLYTDPDSYNMKLRSGFTMNFSMPLTLTRDENGEIDNVKMHSESDGYGAGDFIFNSSNAGFAIDLGATYSILPELTIYASIADLGFINWKQDVYNLSMDGDFEFDGLDLSSSFDSEDDSKPGDVLLDSLNGLFSISETRDSFRRPLPSRIFLGGTWELNHLVNFGLLSRSEIMHGRLEQAVTLSANYNLRRWLSASASYSMMNNSYSNIGLGLALRGGGFQFYVVTDNVIPALMPHKTRNANIWLGLNLVFGHKPATIEATD
ncbi:MAG: DUF5723 family protein [Bacteroidales bacterium]